MVCWLVFLNVVKKYLSAYNVNDEEAKEILLDIEKEVGHNKDLIKAVVDFEKEGLIKRLKKKKKARGKEMAYA
jgi:hypothetical protein